MPKQKLNITFHNPNNNTAALEYVLKVFIEACRTKFENLQKAAYNNTNAEHNGSAL